MANPQSNLDELMKDPKAAGLRMKDSVMETVTCVQENAADILASAKNINETRAAKEAETQVEDQEA